jgi:hypothetical protein
VINPSGLHFMVFMCHGLHVLWSLVAPFCPFMHCPCSPSYCCVCVRKNKEECFPPTNEMVFVFVLSLLAWFLVLYAFLCCICAPSHVVLLCKKEQ